MTTTTTQVVGTRTALTSTGFSTLASATYLATSAYDCSVNAPQDVVVEVEAATTNSASGNKRVCVFLQASLDGTNYQTGPTSGTTTTDEPDLTWLGYIPMNTNSATHRKAFSIKNAIGFVPKKFYVVLKNDLGVALTSGAVYTSEISIVS